MAGSQASPEGACTMGLAQRTSKSAYTIDQYLKFERSSEERHYYLDGKIYAMAGESSAHGDISANLVGSLVNQLRGTPCRARTKDTKVRSGPILSAGETTRGLFSYPDVVVICGEPEYHDAMKDVVLNPKAIVEVLSESTEAFDRGEKFTRMQTWNPGLTDYLLVAQDRPQVEHFTRQADGTWSYRLTTGLDASVGIPSVGCTLKLADAYDRVTFPVEEPVIGPS
jgi:Uma2 family endonuclease